MIVLIPRTYRVVRSATGSALAALVVATLLAGCGSSGSAGATPNAGAESAAVTPAAASGTQGTFNAQLTQQHSDSTAAASAGALVQPAQTTPSKPTVTTPKATTVTTPKTTTVTPPKPAVTKPPASTTPSPPTKLPAKRTHTHTRNRTHTVTAPTRTVTVTRPTKPKTVTRYVTKTVAPNVPTGAFLPSTHPALAQRSFTVPGENVTCTFAAGSVRCEIEQHTWVPPLTPAGCSSSWGNALVLQDGGTGGFACGGDPVTSAAPWLMSDGWDDTVGKITCEVRSFAVDCFSKSGHGFIVSRTGYLVF